MCSVVFLVLFEIFDLLSSYFEISRIFSKCGPGLLQGKKLSFFSQVVKEMRYLSPGDVVQV